MLQQVQAMHAYALGGLTCPPCILYTVRNYLNCLAGDRPLLLSGADDRLVKVWDYQTKACVATLEGHAHNVTAVMFHPELPVILTGCAIERMKRGSVVSGRKHRIARVSASALGTHLHRQCSLLTDALVRRSSSMSRHGGVTRPFLHHDGFLSTRCARCGSALDMLTPEHALAQVRGRNGAHLALEHVPAGEHAQLRLGAGLGARLHRGLQLVSG